MKLCHLFPSDPVPPHCSLSLLEIGADLTLPAVEAFSKYCNRSELARFPGNQLGGPIPAYGVPSSLGPYTLGMCPQIIVPSSITLDPHNYSQREEEPGFDLTVTEEDAKTRIWESWPTINQESLIGPM